MAAIPIYEKNHNFIVKKGDKVIRKNNIPNNVVTRINEATDELAKDRRTGSDEILARMAPIVGSLSRQAGVTMPHLRVHEGSNAFASYNSISVGRALANVADDEQLMGVLAHELGHVIYGDSSSHKNMHRTKTTAKIAVPALVWLMESPVHFSSFNNFIGHDYKAIAAGMAAKFVFDKVAAAAYSFTIRRHESRADAFAARLVGSEAAISGLIRNGSQMWDISYDLKKALRPRPSVSDSLLNAKTRLVDYNEDPKSLIKDIRMAYWRLRSGIDHFMYGTHPSLGKRIKQMSKQDGLS